MAARNALRSRAQVEESRLLPAWQRYTGTLYGALAGGLGKSAELADLWRRRASRSLLTQRLQLTGSRA